MTDEGEIIPLVIGLVLVNLSIFAILACFTLLARHWNSPIIKARGRNLVFAGVSSLILIMACTPLVYKLPSYAIEYKLLTSQVLAFGSVPYFLKGFVLLVKFEVCFHLSKSISSSQEPSQIQANWYVCNQWIIRGYLLFALWILGVSITTLPAILIEDINVLSLYQMVIGGISVLLYLWLFKNLRGKYDEWGIKKELKINVLASLAMVIMYLFFAFFLAQQGGLAGFVSVILFWFLFCLLSVQLLCSSSTSKQEARGLEKQYRLANRERVEAVSKE
jgi:uncharacterized membrane protein